jgi:arylsulfatase A-like enzyme
MVDTGVSVIAQVEAKRPNILLIVSDDMGFSDLGFYGFH